ncbi:MAG: group III truncated hemoglobin [Piscinibacter sp.]|nr:group III truncated hemoglobin [Piscinibacter sp.]
MNAVTDLTRARLAELVHEFYADVRADTLLGPVFDGLIGPRWEPHLLRMVEFWSTVALGTRSFRGNVYAKHMALDGVQPEHFLRWLTLWHRHTNRLLPPVDARELQRVAHGIARNLFHGFFGHFAAFEMADEVAIGWTPA